MNRPDLAHINAVGGDDVDLRSQVAALAPQLVVAAQAVLDEWVQDEHGIDEEFGAGGACDAIARQMASVIASHVDCEIHEGGLDGDDHAFLLLEAGDQQLVVDIPPGVYETGGGFSWRKREGVQLTERDLVIEPVSGLSL